MIADKTEPKVGSPPTASFEPLHHLSASSLKNYLGCSLRFYFRKVLNLSEPVSPAMQLGKAVHEGLRYYNLATWLDEDSSVDTLLSHYREAWTALEDKDAVAYKDNEQRQKLLYQGEQLLQSYHQGASVQSSAKPLGVEVQLESAIPDTDTPLVGIIDLVKQGNIPVDYKTIASTPSDLNLEAWQHELQLIAYQVLLEENTGEAVDYLELVFLVKTKTPKIIHHAIPSATTEQKDRFWSLVDVFLEGVRNERYYPQPGMHCNWCSFRSQCAQWK